MVLLKGRTQENGFIFFTNYLSNKGKQLEQHPYASLTFWWGDLQRQVRVEGLVSQLSPQLSDEYWNLRPLGSQISSAASQQSQPLTSSAQFLEEIKDLEESWCKTCSDRVGKPLASVKDCMKEGDGCEHFPRPAHWGGFGVQPTKIEFWKGRRDRGHDRIVFMKKETQEGNMWEKQRLYP